ncbi:type II secretion system protein [Phascolarctobacterium faecium]|uniref:type II secretion system protein n=1 Tax=Phascolarctobacterium faecium TaxID=33025 RepID=UPI003AB50358
MNFTKNRKGFTLVELVVVIAILGILAGLAIPRFIGATETARGARVIADLRTVESALSMYYAKNGNFYDPATSTTLVTVDGLVKNGLLAAVPIPPTGNMKIEGTKKFDTAAAVPTGSYTITAGATGSGVEAEVQLGNHNISYFLEKKGSTPSNNN